MTVDMWERRSEWPLVGAAMAFLLAFAWPILDPGLSEAATTACDVAQVAAWLGFVVDYAVRLHLSRRRGAYMRTHLVDLAVIVLPVLRPLRLLRLITILNVLNRGASRGVRGRVGVYVVGATLLIIFVGGLAMLDVERGKPGATIQTAGDAWWWAITTITTVGYGDRYPVTLTGRLVAVALMICGIALIGVVTASLATWLIERIRDEESRTRGEVTDVQTELRAVRDELASLRQHLDSQISQTQLPASAPHR